MQFEQLGPYKVEAQVGKGGMGAVYRVRHVETGEVAALKALAPQLAMAEGFRERFEAEIDSLKKLRHENIIRLYGYGEQDGVLFYVMELVEGKSLEEELLAGRRFDWREVAEIGIQTSAALKHAHDHGIVHRDIKPANILMDPSGKLKVADFGIARLFGGTQLTTAGGVLGTADYMSPEQADGRAVTEKCDQYSLGGVLYALLAGRPPFRAKSLPEMLQMQRFAEPEPVRRYAPETPEDLERIIQHLLAKEPEDRFPNFRVLAKLLEAMRRALSRPSKPSVVVEDEDDSYELEDGTDFSIAIRGDVTQPDSKRIPETELGETYVLGEDSNPNVTMRPDLTEYRPPTPSSEATRLIDEEDDLELDLASTPAVKSARHAREKPPAEAKKPIEVPKPKETRFTTVEEVERLAQQQDQTPLAVLIGKLGLLVLTLGLIGWGAWSIFRPKTADELLVEIRGVSSQKSNRSLTPVEPEMEQFMERFPDHPAREEIALLQAEVESGRLERELMRYVQNGGGVYSLQPIEQLFVQAMRIEENNPQKALQELKSIEQLYASAEGNAKTQESETEENGTDKAAARRQSRIDSTLRIIRRTIQQLEVDEKMQQELHLTELNRRMSAAQVLGTKSPAEAIKIYRAIMNLYGAQPWASDIVIKAKAELDRLEAN